MKGNIVQVYLDNCCYNRPFDDQRYIRIAIETQAKLYIQTLITDRKIDLIWSYVVTFENENNPYENKKVSIRNFSENAKIIIEENKTILKEANHFIAEKIKETDALHLACAKYAKADYFITTDDPLLNYKTSEIVVISPVGFVMAWEKGKRNE
ncbi:MAG: hypothetical protein LBT05_13030 [Planctomycetaceae bacterium]|nr:hypothetical protein [Planctomycetaceae bacterium]